MLEFDVYVEHNDGLRVPYKDIAAASTVVDGIRVASLEHLLVLKLDAYAARRGSAKGRKDERDLIRIAHMLTTSGVHKGRLKRFVTDEMLAAAPSRRPVVGVFTNRRGQREAGKQAAVRVREDDRRDPGDHEAEEVMKAVPCTVLIPAPKVLHEGSGPPGTILARTLVSQLCRTARIPMRVFWR